MAELGKTIEEITIEARELLSSGESSGESSAALDLLEDIRSLATDSKYPSYYIVRAEVQIALSQLDEARHSLMEALRLSPNSPRPALLMEGLNRGLPTKTNPPSSLGKKTLADLYDLKPTTHSAPVSDKFNIEQVATALTKERPIVKPSSNTIRAAETLIAVEEAMPSGLVSETLAKLLVQQGKLSEARKVYIQLSRAEPDRYAYFQDRINELRSE